MKRAPVTPEAVALHASAAANEQAGPLGSVGITELEFVQFCKLIHEIAGISLSAAKKPLLVSRLSKRLKHLGFVSFTQYYRHLINRQDPRELQIMVDLLTTNETYFFREPKHFDFLRTHAVRHHGRPFRIWSAAASSGEEAYTMAMVLADALGGDHWEVVGTDISTQVLDRAQRGHYPQERIDGIPPALLKKYCLKGLHEYAGTLLIVKELRERVKFLQSNLLNPRQGLGQFDMIFLRNVMIYFDSETKRKVVSNLLSFLKDDGYFIVGHSETLNGITDELVSVCPTIYRRSAG